MKIKLLLNGFYADLTSMISILTYVWAVVWSAGQVFEVATGGATVAYLVVPGGYPVAPGGATVAPLLYK